MGRGIEGGLGRLGMQKEKPPEPGNRPSVEYTEARGKKMPGNQSASDTLRMRRSGLMEPETTSSGMVADEGGKTVTEKGAEFAEREATLASFRGARSKKEEAPGYDPRTTKEETLRAEQLADNARAAERRRKLRENDETFHQQNKEDFANERETTEEFEDVSFERQQQDEIATIMAEHAARAKAKKAASGGEGEQKVA